MFLMAPCDVPRSKNSALRDKWFNHKIRISTYKLVRCILIKVTYLKENVYVPSLS